MEQEIHSLELLKTDFLLAGLTGSMSLPLIETVLSSFQDLKYLLLQLQDPPRMVQ